MGQRAGKVRGRRAIQATASHYAGYSTSLTSHIFHSAYSARGSERGGRTILQQAIVEENAETIAEKQVPLYRVTAEDVTESTMENTMEHGSSMPDSESILVTIPRLCATPFPGDPAVCLSNTVLACQHTMFLAWNRLLPGYD